MAFVTKMFIVSVTYNFQLQFSERYFHNRYSYSVKNENMDLQAFVANLLDFVYDHIKTQKMWVEAVRKDAYLPELPCDHVKTQLKCENVAKRKGWAFSFVPDQLKNWFELIVLGF